MSKPEYQNDKIYDDVVSNSIRSSIIHMNDDEFKTNQQFMSNLLKDDSEMNAIIYTTRKEEDRVDEFVRHVTVLLKSGFHPKFLSEEEQKVMTDTYGDGWQKKFGYDD